MILDVHPFLQSFTKAGMYNMLPPQMISKKEKDKNKDKFGVSNWQKRCMDTFESIAKVQYHENRKLINNERLLNGEFIEEDYVDNEEDDNDFSEVLQKLMERGRLPKFIKHYDMFRSVINAQIEEFDKLPDTFAVVGVGEQFLNDKMQVQQDMLIEWANAKLNLDFEKYIRDNKIQIPTEFESEEQAQQFQQEFQQMKEARSPKDIGMYMKMNPRHHFEVWGEEEVKNQNERFNIRKLRREEYKDYLTVGRRFRHVKTTRFGFLQETLNYVNVFFHKGKDIEYVQDGDYAGTIRFATASYIIDRYGDKMTESQIKEYENISNLDYQTSRPNTDFFGNAVNYLDTDGNPYNTFLPTKNAFLNRIAPNLGFNFLSLGNMLAYNPESTQVYNDRLYLITEAYWKSYERYGRLCWNNPDNGIFEVIEVNEDFIVPPYIKVLPNDKMISEPEINTIVWAYRVINMQGTKISKSTVGESGLGQYLEIKKCDFQQSIKTKLHKQLPIFGQIANNRNTRSVSQVDMLKPYQFLYNVIMNRMYKMIERNYLPFIAMDIRSLPSDKDWGGDDALIKWMESGQDVGAAQMDTSPANTQGSNQGGTLPRVIDPDITARITAYLNIANGIRAVGLAQLGFTPERVGDMSQADTATGINVSITKSHNATGSWTTEFYELEKEILNYCLELAQYLQTNDKDYSAQFTNSIYSLGIFKTNVAELTLYDLRVYVTNSQEELRKLELYRKLAVENNTILTPMSSRMMMGSMTNAQRILELIKMEEEKAMQREQQQQEINQNIANAQNDLEKAKFEEEKRQFNAKLIADKEIAWIKSRGYVAEGEQDLNSDAIPDAFQAAQFEQQAQQNAGKLGLDRDKLAFEKEKEQNRKQETQQKLSNDKEKIVQSGINSTIMGDKKH